MNDMKLLRGEISDDGFEVQRVEVGYRPGLRPDRAVEAGAPALRPTSALRRFDVLPPGEAPAPGFTSLLDRLRAHAAQGMPARALVFAAPTTSASPGLVMEGLAAQAEHLGLRVVRGELHGACNRSKPARLALTAERPNRCGLNVAPRPAALDAEVQAWLGQHRDADLVLIEGPPLLDSIDAALVARACDGLILVAERGVTERSAVRDAASRARISGCALLGVVVTGARLSMPGWVRRLLGAHPQPMTF
jgi:hypothetical protein